MAQFILSPLINSLVCLRCNTLYTPTILDTNDLRYVCSCRPNVLSDVGTLDARYDYAAIQQRITPAQISEDDDRSIGRYWPLLPFRTRASLSPVAVGNTPLMRVQRLAATLGLDALYIKDDGRNPSASFKDRASAVAVALAQENKLPVVATASTGNAAAALAGQCAAAGQKSVIFVPTSAPRAKIAQLLVYGSTVLAVDGSYDDAFDLCTAACKEFGWYNRNTGYNPFMTEGKKSVAFEMAEQFGKLLDREIGRRGERGKGTVFVAPDVVFVSVGDGCIIGGVHKGFKDLLALGWIEKMPRLYGVQSTGSAALYHAWRTGAEFPEPVQATTRADSISVNAPRDPIKALNAVRQTHGAFIAVPDEAILSAMLPLARLGGVFAEPAGAAAFAGLQLAVAEKLVRPDETIVVINTGSGLKDIDAAIQATGEPTVIAPTVEAVKQSLGL